MSTAALPAADAVSDQATDQALGILDRFAAAAQMPLDRLRARRALVEATRAIPGAGPQTWAQRLVKVGESVDLRVQTVACSLEDALAFVGQGLPVAAGRQSATADVAWWLLVEVRGRRIRLAGIGSGANDRWVTVRQLVRSLGLSSAREPVPWVLGQPALPCEPPRPGHTDGHHAPTPLARLLALLRPETKDLWVITIFSMVVGVLMLAIPVGVEALVNTVAFGRFLQPVVVLSILLFTVLAFAAAMRGLIVWVVEIIQRRLFVRVVEDLAYRLPRVRREAFDGQYGPELLNRFFDVVTVQKVVATMLLDALAIVLQAIVGLLVLAFYHPFLLGFDIVFLGLVAFIIFVLGRGAVTTAIQESRAKYAVAAWLEELARHGTTFKLQAGAQFALERADRLAAEYLAARQRHFRVVLRQVLFALGLQALAATALLGIGGWLVIRGQLTLGQLVAAELIVTVIAGSFAKLGKHMENLYDLLAAMNKLGHLFDLPTEAHDKLFHLPPGAPAAVSVHALCYGYEGDHPVLQDLTFALRPGERVGLVGPPASGKSTLVDLLAGLRQPASGHIELDGIDLRELRPDSLREHLAITRAVEIFAGTIDENVHLHRPQLTARDVREALAAVGLVDELTRLPGGLNTRLEPDGAPLTSSQAARLMLARAIAGRPRLLLIDGTLDALPEDMLAYVLDHLMAPDAPWTLLVNTGRREVLARCQRVLPVGGPVAKA